MCALPQKVKSLLLLTLTLFFSVIKDVQRFGRESQKSITFFIFILLLYYLLWISQPALPMAKPQGIVCGMVRNANLPRKGRCSIFLCNLLLSSCLFVILVPSSIRVNLSLVNIFFPGFYPTFLIKPVFRLGMLSTLEYLFPVDTA